MVGNNLLPKMKDYVEMLRYLNMTMRWGKMTNEHFVAYIVLTAWTAQLFSAPRSAPSWLICAMCRRFLLCCRLFRQIPNAMLTTTQGHH